MSANDPTIRSGRNIEMVTPLLEDYIETDDPDGRRHWQMASQVRDDRQHYIDETGDGFTIQLAETESLTVDQARHLWYELAALIRAASHLESPYAGFCSEAALNRIEDTGLSIGQVADLLDEPMERVAAIVTGVDQIGMVHGFMLDQVEPSIMFPVYMDDSKARHPDWRPKWAPADGPKM